MSVQKRRGCRPMMVSLQRFRPSAAMTLATLCFFCSVDISLGSRNMAAKYSVSQTVSDSYNKSSCNVTPAHDLNSMGCHVDAAQLCLACGIGRKAPNGEKCGDNALVNVSPCEVRCRDACNTKPVENVDNISKKVRECARAAHSTSEHLICTSYLLSSSSASS